MMNQTPMQPYGYADPNAMYGYGMQPQVGPMYPNQGNVNFTNPLGEKVIQELLKNGGGAPKLQITQEDMNQAICTHRYNNQSMLYQLPNGKVKCKICGAEFNLQENLSDEDIQNATDNMWDILQTYKHMWLDVPDQLARDNFQILAVIQQTPTICKIAADHLQKYAGFNPSQQYQNMNGFAQLNAITGGGMNMGMGYPMMQPQQPGYPAPANYPYSTQQPMGYPAMQPNMMTPMQQQMTAAAPGQTNGFGYSQPAQVNVQPTQAVPTPDQQGAAPAANNAQPATEGGAQVTQTLHV